MGCFEVYKPDLKFLQLSGSYKCDSLQMSNPKHGDVYHFNGALPIKLYEEHSLLFSSSMYTTL